MYTVKTNMPSNESYRSYLESPSERWKEVPKAVRNLYRDEQAFLLYQEFKQRYSGDPYTAYYPEIIRSRGGHTIQYDMPVLSAITTRADGKNHLICIRSGRKIDTNNHQQVEGLDARLQFFVVTADFTTFDMTEWWLSDVKANAFGEPRRLELYLSHNPVQEAPEYIEPYHETGNPFDELDRLSDAEQDRLDHDAKAMKFVYENQQAHLTWGNGDAPSTFRNLFEVEGDLYLLHRAELDGQFGPYPVGHRHVIEHMQSRVA
jgi:hypothetical protein